RDPNLADERRGLGAAQRQHGRHGDEGMAIDDRPSRGDGLQREQSAAAGGLARQPVMTRVTAFGPLPFLSGSTSKQIPCPWVSRLGPAGSAAVTCTKPSWPPPSGLMKP